MPIFETDTGTIYYRVFEPGFPDRPALTLLHNFMSSGRSAWGSMLNALGQRWRVILPDLPGHGRSRGYPPDFSHREFARQLAELMRAEKADQGHLAGVSSGGMVAQHLVHAHFAQPATLTLVSTSHSTNLATTGAGHPLLPENFRAGSNWLEATARLHDPYHYPGYFDQVLLAGFRQLTPDQTIDLPREELAAWRLPVCIIHGEQDEFFPASIVREMAEVLPNAELHVIPGQSHSLIFKQPWTVEKILLEFLARHEPALPGEPIAPIGEA